MASDPYRGIVDASIFLYCIDRHPSTGRAGPDSEYDTSYDQQPESHLLASLYRTGALPPPEHCHDGRHHCRHSKCLQSEPGERTTSYEWSKRE